MTTSVKDIENLEDPFLCFKSLWRDCKGAQTVEELAITADCRPFESFLYNSSLKSATVFMRGSLAHGKKAQLTTTYRCKHFFQSNNFKPAQHIGVSEQFRNAVWALDEEVKFLTYINKTEWPCKMHTLRDNLLRTNVLDRDTTGNHGNQNSILPVLTTFARHFPAQADSLNQDKSGSAVVMKDTSELFRRNPMDIDGVSGEAGSDDFEGVCYGSGNTACRPSSGT